MDGQNRTALYWACTECNLRIVRYLLTRKADPRIACVIDEKTEETPLGCAIRWGYVSLVSRYMNNMNDGIEELLSDECVCKADFKTIQLLRKRCRNHEIEVLLKEKYQQYKDQIVE